MSADDEDERRLCAPEVEDDAPDGSAGDAEDLFREAGAALDPGIAILVEMARRGEIDPWNVDIIDVTDRYLAALAAKAAGGAALAPGELARSARCIFYAAALLNMKARALAERHVRELVLAAESQDAAPDAELEGDELDPRGLRPGDLPLLYPGVDRSILAPRERRPRERALTLTDLIAALRALDEKVMKREAALAELAPWDDLAAYDESLSTSHKDALEHDKALVRDALARLLAEAQRVEDRVLVAAGFTRAQVFLALLSLANDEEVDLEQEAIYGPLFVRSGTRFVKPAPSHPSVEAPAQEVVP